MQQTLQIDGVKFILCVALNSARSHSNYILSRFKVTIKESFRVRKLRTFGRLFSNHVSLTLLAHRILLSVLYPIISTLPTNVVIITLKKKALLLLYAILIIISYNF